MIGRDLGAEDHVRRAYSCPSSCNAECVFSRGDGWGVRGASHTCALVSRRGAAQGPECWENRGTEVALIQFSKLPSFCYFVVAGAVEFVLVCAEVFMLFTVWEMGKKCVFSFI